MSLVAGVDSSTQGCKIVIVDRETGNICRSGRASHPPGTEVDPELWWNALQEAIAHAGGLEGVSAISIAAQQHGMVLLNKKGHVIRPALLWNDTRSAAQATDLITDAGGADVFAEKIGIIPVASFTACKLRWVRDNEPENTAEAAAVCLPHDYLTWRLLGYGPDNPQLDMLVTDRSDASGTAYWSSVKGEYDWKMFELAFGRRGREASPEFSDNSDLIIVPRVLGPYEPAGKAPSGIVVGPGAGDNAGAALGLGIGPGDVVVSIGTSGAVFSPTPAVINDPSGTVAGFSDATGINLPLTCTLNGARVIDAAKRVLDVDFAEYSRLALEAPPGSDGLCVIPYLEGERTPNLPHARGTLYGISLENMTRSNIARAHIEGVLCSMAECIESIQRLGRVKVNRIHLIGGAAANPAVQECASHIFTGELLVPHPGEYVALGAAVQACWTLTKAKPTWKVQADRRLDAKLVPKIYNAYIHARNTIYA